MNMLSRSLLQGLLCVMAWWPAVMAEPPVPVAMHFATKEFPPYAFADADGHAAGPMVELLASVCSKADWHCKVELLPWRRAYGMAEQGQLDGLFPVVNSPARRASFQLSPSVTQGSYVLVAKSCGATLPCAGPVSLAGRAVAAYGPSDASQTLQQLLTGVPASRSLLEPDHRTVLRKLKAGRYGQDGLALVNRLVAQRQWVGGELRELGTVKELAYAYAFVAGRVEPAKLKLFTELIHELCRNGRMAEIFKPHGLPVSDCGRPAASQA